MEAADCTAPRRRRVIILGAAGRDYHLFNTVYRPRAEEKQGAPADGDASASATTTDLVVAFTHAQIPHISSTGYPPSLSGYPTPIPIYLEKDLERAITETRADACIFAYSDVSWRDLGALSQRVRAAGADFVLPSAGAGATNDPSTLSPARPGMPVVSVTAVRTGCGKSQVCARVAEAARKQGLKVCLIRHPMPYGDLERMRVQRFAQLEDLDLQDATVEEREEYEQHIRSGVVVFAGVDYADILKAAETEGKEDCCDVILWDGGNNDTPFYRAAPGAAPGLDICVCDPFRPNAHETHYPGGVNFARADHLVVNKANTAPRDGVEAILKACREINPSATTYVTASSVTLLGEEDLLRGKRVLCVDDGPTITHGGVPTGAAVVAATQGGCSEVVDPRPFFVGALAEALAKYSHIGATVPALGYGLEQIKDLAETLRRAVKGTGAEVVVIGTPTDLGGVLASAGEGDWAGGVPVVRATYAVEDMAWGEGDGKAGGLGAMLDAWMAERRREKDERATRAA
jgi:predicted GTPase